MECEFDEPQNDSACDPDTAAQLYRIGQEAVSNALKHGHATKIRISLQATRDQTELRVSDNGQGFTGSPSNGHGLGMHAMKFRADVIGAELHIQSEAGKGTWVTCTVRKKA